MRNWLLTYSFLIIPFLFVGQVKNAEDSLQIKKQTYYEEAYLILSNMLEGKEPTSFKKAVFTVENAFFEGFLPTTFIDIEIKNLCTIAKEFKKVNGATLSYEFSDRDHVLTWFSLFTTLTDTIDIRIKDSVYKKMPYTYDFEDLFGQKEWSNTFVTKLLFTEKGNCHSMPYLYKILAEELGVTAHLAMAPSHIYIKHQTEKVGMFNTELTSATFPTDAWLMSSGYIHIDAIRSGIYMDRLTDKQSIALCLFDLAKGFEMKFEHANDAFILKCLNKSLDHYPNNISALLFKSKVLKRGLSENDMEMKSEQFLAYQNLILEIYDLGYRRMPMDMYMEWLMDLKNNTNRYLNKDLPLKTN